MEGALRPQHEAREDVTGTLNGKPFSSITDADPRLGARLEVFAAGQYTLLPFENLASLSVEEPKRLRDLLWAPARVTGSARFRDFEFGEILIPVLYPLTFQTDDDEVRLGHATDWQDLPDGSAVPVGSRLLLVDGEPVPILEVRQLEITPPDTQD